jgi:hypothetical protein
VLTKNSEDWPEVARRVEAKLGKTIIERIEELNTPNLRVVGGRKA